MTEKWYQSEPNRSLFLAAVLSCRPEGDGFLVELDRSCFYPEGGGQPADQGTLGGVRVLDVHEKGGAILHRTDGPLEPGARVEGAVDWSRRRALTQQHTGEHILSGLVHRAFGYENVGFHIGHGTVTVDFSGPLSPEDLDRLEREANEVIWENRPVTAEFPPQEELEKLEYRSKKELDGAVRIVTVEDCDRCACCGTHTARTGEVGVLKITGAQSYKGGTRVNILCGGWALGDYGQKAQSVTAVSNLLSAKPHEIGPAVERLLLEAQRLERERDQARAALYRLRAEAVPPDAPLACLFEKGLSQGELRAFGLELSQRCQAAALFSGDDETGYQFALSSTKRDMRTLSRALLGQFQGRGGGKPELVQGTVRAPRAELEAFCRAWSEDGAPA